MTRLHTYAVHPPAPAWDSQRVDTEAGHIYHHEVAGEATEYFQNRAAENIDTYS